jgi:hypothetical protein
MRWLSILATCLLGGSLALPLSAADLKARCQQLLDYYEWFGSSRHENTDGVYNLDFERARVDCDHGRYEQGIAELEGLLRRKKFVVPPPTGGSQGL